MGVEGAVGQPRVRNQRGDPKPSMPSVLNRRPAASMIRCCIACLCSLLYRTACSFTPPDPLGSSPRTLFSVRS
jgi:hypothetical protein